MSEEVKNNDNKEFRRQIAAAGRKTREYGVQTGPEGEGALQGKRRWTRGSRKYII